MTLQEFANNINGEFALNPSYPLTIGNRNINLDSVRVKIQELDKIEAVIKISSADGINEAAKSISQDMIARLEKSVNKIKKIANKVIRDWENNPDNFKFEKDSWGNKKIYKHRNLLSDSEYSYFVGIYFGKITISNHDLRLSTGYGSLTYFEKSYYEEGIEKMDKWHAKELKKIKSAAFLKRIVNTINKESFHISIFSLEKNLSIPTNGSKQEKKTKGFFPFSFESSDLNYFLTEWCCDPLFVDDDMMEDMKEGGLEFPVDELLGWEITAGTDGFHNHDGQVCDYEVVFTSPDGHEYHLHNSHCLMTGWNFHGKQTPK